MLKFETKVEGLLKKADHLFVVGSEKSLKKHLKADLVGKQTAALLSKYLKETKGGVKGASVTSLTGDSAKSKITVVTLPSSFSRSNSPTHKEAIFRLTSGLSSETTASVLFLLDKEEYYTPSVAAISRHLRNYNLKKGAKKKTFHVAALNMKGELVKASKEVKATGEGVAWACQMVDTAPTDLNPKAFSAEIKKLFKSNKSVSVKEITGAALVKEGLNGIWGVGKAAVEAPRMLVLDFKPAKASTEVFALVGKGLTYDTGGLSLKISGNMVGMKADMGGAAAVIGAFYKLVSIGSKKRVVACVGLAENAIGPAALKPDDILHMHSGKTVEVNNTDAEGRLVLADCMSYITRKYKPELIMDAATLTGAQLIATGMLHGAIVSNNEKVEKLASKVAKDSGDLVSPLPFAPEFFQDEFQSNVADMRNSVKNRMNAQSSCAAQFIYSHIDDIEPNWMHLDLAGPATTVSGLGTGYGVDLLSRIVDSY